MDHSSWFSQMRTCSLTRNNLEKILFLQLRDLCDVEHQLTIALPNFLAVASQPEFKCFFEKQIDGCRHHLVRLEQVGTLIGRQLRGGVSSLMRGMIAEASKKIVEQDDKEIRDTILVATAQRIVFYKVAGYGCSRYFAHRLGFYQIATLLSSNLEDENDADECLFDLADRVAGTEIMRH